MRSTRIGSKIVMMVCAVVIVISAVMGVIISYKVESVLQSQATELLQKKLSWSVLKFKALLSAFLLVLIPLKNF
ncbi:hypothetical protein JP0111_14780 [Helicobacter pylori]|nr:hypothetical protein JP0111_14780 [Helicobacter pylori]